METTKNEIDAKLIGYIDIVRGYVEHAHEVMARIPFSAGKTLFYYLPKDWVDTLNEMMEYGKKLSKETVKSPYLGELGAEIKWLQTTMNAILIDKERKGC